MISMIDLGIKKGGKDVLHLVSNQNLHPLHEVFSLKMIKNKLIFSSLISTVCFKSGTTLAACTKKKRRRDIMDEALPEENEIRISPSINDDTEDLEEAHDNLRDPRFLL